MLASDANGYVNWGFDNHVYSKGESLGPYYTMGTGLFVSEPATLNVILPDDKRNLIEGTLDSMTVYDTWGYDQLPCKSERRFDHIGVMFNGDQKKHKALYYINNVDPTHINHNYKYDNIENPDTTDLTHTSGRFADAGVDDRLFTFWVDYDGTTMKVYYTLGKYDEAVKPETPVISYDVDLSKVLGTNNDIRVGFTSSVGSSKANHTVHGFSFANYVESDYTVEHYKWNRNTNRYEIVSADTEVLMDRVGKEVTATSKTYENYRYNPSASLDGAEPKDTGIITGDGNLKMRFYYDPIETTYTVKKFYQQADGSFVEDTAERRNGNGYVGDSIEANTTDMIPAVDKALYEFNDSVTGTIKDKVLVEDESQNELKLYFVKKNTEYRTEYYLQQTDGTYILAPGEALTWTVGAIGTSASATIKTFDGYTKVTVNNGVDVSRENITALAFDRDDNVMKVYYNLNTSYKVEYYYQKADRSFGTTPDSVSADRAEVAGNTAAVTEADKTPTKSGYAFDNGNAKNVLTTILKPDVTTVLKVYFVKEDTRYKTEYYLQQPDGSYVKDSSSEWTDAKVGDSVVAADKTFTGYTKVNVNSGSDKTVDSIASLVKDENSNVMKLYYNKKNESPNTSAEENEKNEKAPFIKGDNGKEGWDVIRSQVNNAKTGDTITVDMNGTTVVPGDVIRDIKGKDITIVFDMGSGITWRVNGQSVTADQLGDIDFSLKTGTRTIPVDIINNVTGERYTLQISLAHEGEFGFTAVLSVNTDVKNAGLYANLFYYNVAAGKMEFICADEIAADGIAELTFTHASDYAIIIDTEPMDGSKEEENQSPKTGDTTPITGLFVLVLMSGAGLIATRRRRVRKSS